MPLAIWGQVIIQTATPGEDPVRVGTLWYDVTNALYKVCTSVGPYVFATVGSGGGGVPTTRLLTAGTGLTGGGDLSADRTFAVSFGALAGTACEGNDSRLSDARTPTAHATSHQNGGSDEVAVAAAAANAIPKAGAGSTLAIGWFPLGVLSTTLCVGNDARLSDARTPTAHATSHKNGGGDEVAVAVAAANAIPKAGAGAKLAAGWISSVLASSDLTNDAALEKVANKDALSGYVGIDANGAIVATATTSTATFTRTAVGDGSNSNAFLLQRSNATPVNNDSVGMVLRVKQADGTLANVAGIRGVILDKTNNVATGALVFCAKASGAPGSIFETEVGRFDQDGNFTAVGTLTCKSFAATGTANSTVAISDAVTNAASVALQIRHTLTAGTPANGNGVQVLYRAQTTDATERNMVAHVMSWSDATAGTRTATMKFTMLSGGAAIDSFVFDGPGNLTALGFIKSSSASGGIGYATGAGGAQTQLTNKSTTVTLNTICGTITMFSAALAAGASVNFQLTNSQIAVGDVVNVTCQASGATAATYVAQVTDVAAGSCLIRVTNFSASSRTEANKINFAVIKAVSA